MDQNSKPALIPDQLKETVPDSFIAVPRDSDTAVIYWSLSNQHLPFHDGGRLCLQILGQTTDLTDTIILHREQGHFIVPLLADERKYEFQLGWSDVNGFAKIFSESIELPELPENPLGAHSTAMDYRGSVFWGQHQNSAN